MSSSSSEPCLQTSSVPITQNEEQAAQQKDDSSYVLCQYDSSENEEGKGSENGTQILDHDVDLPHTEIVFENL